METSSSLVTIAIPTYNRARLLARSILSAQQQTYKNIEIIVSDNNSSDDTQFLCNSLAAKDSRIRYVRQLHNIGGTGNFNWLAIENPSTLTSFTIGRYDGMLSGSTPVLLSNSSDITFHWGWCRQVNRRRGRLRLFWFDYLGNRLR